jgi:hypothetical protein
MARTESVQTSSDHGRGDAADAAVRHLLVVANETLEGEGLARVATDLVLPGGSVLVVCPILVSRAGYWACEFTAPLLAARQRLLETVDALGRTGLEVRGTVGDANPLQAIEDALCEFPAEHILISTHPPARSTWLERRVVAGARARFAQTVTHVIVDREDPAAERSAGSSRRALRRRERTPA